MATSLDQLDTASLSRYLRAHIAGFQEILAFEKFKDGQSNPTYRLTANSGEFVLRRKPSGVLLKSAHAVDREYRVIKSLADTDVPVPIALHLCEDTDVIGSEFYIMSYVAGRTFWKPALPELDNAARTQLYNEMNKTLAAIHSVDIATVGLEDFGKPGNYFERQVTRWSGQYKASETEHILNMNAIMDWLTANMVPDDGQVSLVHGDFRIDNLMCSDTGTEILAVLDWELSTLGHPFADLAYQCSLWRMPPEAKLAGLKGIDQVALGIPSEEQYVEQYCHRRGISSIDHWKFYLVFSLFRMAAIVQGVKKRALDGNASSDKAMEVGSLVGPLSEEAAAIAFA